MLAVPFAFNSRDTDLVKRAALITECAAAKSEPAAESP